VNGHVAQRRGNIAFHHPQREAFHHRRLADPGLAGQDGVVLSAPDEDIHHLADLEIAPENRIDFSPSGLFGEIDGELIQGLGPRGCRGWSGHLPWSGGSPNILVFPRSGNDVDEMLA